MDIQINGLRIVESELGINVDVIVGAIEDALLHAYQHVPGAVRSARVEMDRNAGRVTVYAPEVDEEGEVIGELDDTPEDFGRIATSTARSIIAQHLRDAGTDRVLGSFKGEQGEVISGVVQQSPRHDSRDLLVSVDEHEAILRVEEQVPTERSRHGNHIRALVFEVSVGTHDASVRLSQTHPDFACRLFEMEVPGIQDGTVEIVALAREAGHRAKTVVWSDTSDVNVKGARIGHNGQRVRVVTIELGGEKIDIVDYDDDPKTFITASLSPAKAVCVDTLGKAERQARMIVPNGRTSLAIGKEAQNVRLAVKLTGWSIDIHKESGDLNAFDDWM